jgi:hypothetical protein
VLRRLASVLVVWLGLLWASSPALACARSADRDCCPEGGTSPCSDEGSGLDLNALATLCCVIAPAASPVVSADTSRTAHVQPHDSGSPDPIVAFAWFATLTPSDHRPPLTRPDASLVRTDAALTYLHTRRLRL